MFSLSFNHYTSFQLKQWNVTYQSSKRSDGNANMLLTNKTKTSTKVHWSADHIWSVLGFSTITSHFLFPYIFHENTNAFLPSTSQWFYYHELIDAQVWPWLEVTRMSILMAEHTWRKMDDPLEGLSATQTNSSISRLLFASFQACHSCLNERWKRFGQILWQF